MKTKREIKEFVEKNFREHTDFTGTYVEVNPEANLVRSIDNLTELLYDFIGSDHDFVDGFVAPEEVCELCPYNTEKE